MKKKEYEIAIIGGGPAGLSAALVFGRTLTSTVIINEEKPRNRVTQASHGFITRDGTHPNEFLHIAKLQLQRYPSISYIKSKVNSIRYDNNLFHLNYGDKQIIYSKKLIIATGLIDDLDTLNIEHIEDAYGKSVFICPFCDGWEWKDKPLALISAEYAIFEYAKILNRWSKDLIIFTNGLKVLSPRQKKELDHNGIKFFEEKIVSIQSEEGYLKNIILADGQQIGRDAAFIPHQASNQAYQLLKDLNIDIDDSLETDQYIEHLIHNQETPKRHLYIIGDAKNGFSSLVGAASEAYQVAKQITYELAEENWVEID